MIVINFCEFATTLIAEYQSTRGSGKFMTNNGNIVTVRSEFIGQTEITRTRTRTDRTREKRQKERFFKVKETREEKL